ncbi:hypothetical protein FQN54_006024 [Arachnomyces sp. PD_36]|nr:hypothetical protein FQN54_006024 [Arachnomyces sp. PD_36]
MVHYIRFLKPPKHNSNTHSPTISALVTITTDLGDSFLHTDTTLTAHLLCGDDETHTYDICTRKLFPWKAGSRELSISIPLAREVSARFESAGGGRLAVSESGSARREDVVERVVAGWSAPFGAGGEAEKVVERWVSVRDREGKQANIYVWEEMGNSIALHVWDAALACTICFQHALEGRDSSMVSLREIFQRNNAPSGESGPLSAIELGTGCGVVGIGLAQMLRNCKALLTDLPAAEELASRNISNSQLAEGSRLEFRALDWDDEDAGEDIYGSTYDMIIVSDCTYNSDSLPALVRVLSKLTSTSSPGAMVLVAMKRRHASEEVFFELMENAGFWIYDQGCVLLPSLVVTAEDGVEKVEIYAFRWRNE